MSTTPNGCCHPPADHSRHVAHTTQAAEAHRRGDGMSGRAAEYTADDALRDVCRHFCAKDAHDDACLALRAALTPPDAVEQWADGWDVRPLIEQRLAQAWEQGHRDVCTDCCCPDDHNPYRTTPPAQPDGEATA